MSEETWDKSVPMYKEHNMSLLHLFNALEEDVKEIRVIESRHILDQQKIYSFNMSTVNYLIGSLVSMMIAITIVYVMIADNEFDMFWGLPSIVFSLFGFYGFREFHKRVKTTPAVPIEKERL